MNFAINFSLCDHITQSLTFIKIRFQFVVNPVQSVKQVQVVKVVQVVEVVKVEVIIVVVAGIVVVVCLASKEQQLK